MIFVNERCIINWALSARVRNASQKDLMLRNLLSAGRLGQVFQGRQEGCYFIHPSGKFNVTDRQTYAPRKPNFYPAMLSSMKISPLLPQMEVAPEIHFYPDKPCDIHDFIFPMLRLYRLWHGMKTNTRESIEEDDLGLAEQCKLFMDQYTAGWQKLPGQNYNEVRTLNGENIFLPFSQYQHPSYMVPLTVFEYAAQPEPIFSPTAYNSPDLLLTSDPGVFNKNHQTVFVDQLELIFMNVNLLRFKKLHWLLLDDTKSSYGEAISFASKARKENLNLDFIKINKNGKEIEQFTIPRLVKESKLTEFELPDNLRFHYLGMIDLFGEANRGHFISPILSNDGFTKVFCDSVDTALQILGSLLRSLTSGISEYTGWLNLSRGFKSLLLIDLDYKKLAAKHCSSCEKDFLFVFDIASVGGMKGNEKLQTAIRENDPEIAVILATNKALSSLGPVIETLQSKDIPILVFAPASLRDSEIFATADTWITATRISSNPEKIVIKQDNDCKTLECIENGWKVCKSSEGDIQASNRETDPQHQLSEIKRLDKLPEQEDLI